MPIRRFAIPFLFSVWLPATFAQAVTTPEILGRSLSAVSNCLSWRWIGNCHWLTCGIAGCTVQTSMKVRHYRPDLLVAIHRFHNDIPWQEAGALLAGAQRTGLRTVLQTISANQYPVSGSDPSIPNRRMRDINLRFFEATVLGHPVEKLPGFTRRLFCDPVTTAGKPYYQSSLDAIGWRFAFVESLSKEALIPGMRDISNNSTQTWGSVYPRSGFVVQQSPAKAAAVIAQRACDIVIGPKGDHIAIPLEPLAPYTEVANTLDETDPDTGVWQMIHPLVDTDCGLFGSDEPNWDFGRINQQQTFLWNLWRPYECCEPRGQKYLGAIHF